MAENILQVIEHLGELVIDSRLIAQALDIEHKTVLQTINDYKTQIEKVFGVLSFQNAKPLNGSKGGRPSKYVLLTEDQSTFLMTLSRNTEAVIECKANLVKAFRKAKEESKPRQRLGAYTKRVEEIEHSCKNIPPGHWCVLEEAASLLIYVEATLKMPVDKADLLDGSVGKHWSNYRKDKPWAGDRIEFRYTFPDGRVVNPWAYQDSELFEFRRWLKATYRPTFLPDYLSRKYGVIVKV